MTNQPWFRRILIAATLLACVTSLPLKAAGQAEDQDPPDRVARVNYLSGSVLLQPGGKGDWTLAAMNRPLTTGDNLWTEKAARAEFHAGSTAIRLNSETGLTIVRLDDHALRLGVSAGAVMVDLRHAVDGDLVEIDTPNLQFSLLREGEYRIDVNGTSDQTEVTTWKGLGEAVGDGTAFDVVAGERVRFSATGPMTHEVLDIGEQDAFEKWAFARDVQDQRADPDYVSDRITGYEDLDAYGRWDYGDDGLEWIPNDVSASWAPFENGEWSWIEPWGWTWVDAEPWGFAPFHYGRWEHNAQGWCWLPGQLSVRNVYMPAPVVFLQPEGQPTAGKGRPAVAWVPLGPHEIYLPPYRASVGYVNKVNLLGTGTDLGEIAKAQSAYASLKINWSSDRYENSRAPHGVTAVSESAFTHSRPVQGGLVGTRSLTISRASFSAQVQPVEIKSARPAVGSAPNALLRASSSAVAPASAPAPFGFIARSDSANSNTAQAAGVPAQASIPASLRSVPPVRLQVPGNAMQSSSGYAAPTTSSGRGGMIVLGTTSVMTGREAPGRGGDQAVVATSDPVVRSAGRVGEGGGHGAGAFSGGHFSGPQPTGGHSSASFSSSSSSSHGSSGATFGGAGRR